jgi:hypothetical protein
MRAAAAVPNATHRRLLHREDAAQRFQVIAFTSRPLQSDQVITFA